MLYFGSQVRIWYTSALAFLPFLACLVGSSALGGNSTTCAFDTASWAAGSFLLRLKQALLAGKRYMVH